MQDLSGLKDAVAAAAKACGADLVKVADLAILAGIETGQPGLLEPWQRAVSIAVALDHAELEGIVDAPTPRYADHYRAVNVELERIAEAAAEVLRQAGWQARPLKPTTENFDPVRLIDELSHKAVAVAAGIGWQGKSLLTVSPEFGPRIRLATVLTDAPLPPDGLIRNRCADCSACADACPAGAIKNVNTDWHYESREEAIHLERCRKLLKEDFKSRPGVDASICGVCVRVCPWGRRAERRAAV